MQPTTAKKIIELVALDFADFIKAHPTQPPAADEIDRLVRDYRHHLRLSAGSIARSSVSTGCINKH
jgi:hypothetical protein